MNKKEKLIKKSLIKAMNSVRKKYRDLHNMRSGEELRNEEIFKPITGKLDVLIDKPGAVESKGSLVEPKIEIKKEGPRLYKTPSRVTERRRKSKSSPSLNTAKRISELRKRNQEYNDLVTGLKINPTFEKEVEKPEFKQEPTFGESSTSFASLRTGGREDGQTIIIAQPKEKKVEKLIVEPASSTLLSELSLNTSKHGLSPKLRTPHVHTTRNRTQPYNLEDRKDSEEETDSGDDTESAAGSGSIKLLSPRPRSTRTASASILKSLIKKKTGSGIDSSDFMRYDKNGNVSYTYWNDPNELVDRLRLLVASKSAGHSGHNNEIMSIVEELREADIIV